MKREILLSKMLRLPTQKAIEIYKKYSDETEVNASNFAIHQQAVDIIGEKTAVQNRIREDVIKEARMYLAFMVSRDKMFADLAYEKMKRYPMIIWIELIGALDTLEITTLLKSYGNDMPSPIIESLIINLPESKQAKEIEKYCHRLNSKDDYFQTFYYCLGEQAKEKLRTIFKTDIEEDYVSKIEELEEKNLIEGLISLKEQLSLSQMDDIIEKILLKTRSKELICSSIEIFSDRLNEISDMRFKLLVKRIISIHKTDQNNQDYFSFFDEEKPKKSIELEIFEKLKPRFYTLGLYETLKLLNVQVNYYDDNKIGNEIIFSFLDTAYEDESLKDYVNDRTIKSLIEMLKTKCQSKTYTTEDLDILISKIKTDPPLKLIRDDYIEAIIACGKLMQDNQINNQSPSFIKLRNLFNNMLKNNVKKDGTYNEDINLNGIFYRLVKGTLDFDKVITTKTYKGLLYLTKSGICINNPDDTTQFLTDEQVAKLDIKPLLRWKRELLKKEAEEKAKNPEKRFFSNSAFLERMGLQLLLYFGERNAKHILDSSVSKNRLENLFDNINYKTIKVNQNGRPIVNQELIDFLFGKGNISEQNTVINKILRGELLDFGRILKELCNDYETVKKQCHGILTVKRIKNYFSNSSLPLKLKPNEENFASALREMQTSSETTLQKGIDLCHMARKRVTSSIPKISGKVGDFSYEILDLNDPFALAVGYLSHCCFVVNGVSDSALKHSMSSENGRTFIVKYKDKFLAQSWIWRNGEIVCFDSVEAGGYTHGIFKDDLRILDVYKKAAKEIINESKLNEAKEECIKAVTLGNSDFIFEDLEEVTGQVPRPLERDTYVYDSNRQRVLAGKMPKEPKYGSVIKKYYDNRQRVYTILDVEKAKDDELDEALLRLQSIKYDVDGSEELTDLTNINQLFVGSDWYIKTTKTGEVDAEILPGDYRALDECKKYAKVLGIEIDDDLSLEDGYVKDREDTVKHLKLTKISKSRRS